MNLRKTMKVLVFATLVICELVSGRVALHPRGRNSRHGMLQRLKRQSASSSRRIALPKAIPYASLSTGKVPARVKNRVAAGRPVSPASSSSTADSSGGSTQGASSGGYGGQNPYSPMGMSPMGSGYPYNTGYGDASRYGGQSQMGATAGGGSAGAVPLGKSIYPFPNQQALSGYTRPGYQNPYVGTSQSMTPYGAGYPQQPGYPQAGMSQLGGYGQMYGGRGGYPMPMNPYATGGMYGQPVRPMTPYAYPQGGYYGGYSQPYQEPSGVSIGSAYRDPTSRYQSYLGPVNHADPSQQGSYGGSRGGSRGYGGVSSSYGSSQYGGGSRHGSSNPYRSSSYGGGGSTDTSRYGGGTRLGGSSPLGGSSGSTRYGGNMGASSPYGGDTGSSSASYGNSAGSYPYGRTGSTYGGESTGSAGNNPYGGYASYGTGEDSATGDSSSAGTGVYGGSDPQSGQAYGGQDSRYGYGGGGYGEGSPQGSAEQGGSSQYGSQTYGGGEGYGENPYSQTTGSRYGSSSGSRYSSGRTSYPDSSSSSSYGGTGQDSDSASPYSYGQYDSSRGGGYGQAGGVGGYGQAGRGGSDVGSDVPQGYGRFMNPSSADSSNEEVEEEETQSSSYSQTQGSEPEESYNPFAKITSRYPSLGSQIQGGRGQGTGGVEQNTESVAQEGAEVGNTILPGASDDKTRAIATRENDDDKYGPFLIMSRYDGGRSGSRGREGEEKEERGEHEEEESVEDIFPSSSKYASLKKCLPTVNGLPDLHLDHRKMKRSIFLDSKPIGKLSCAKEENCLAPSAYTDNPAVGRRLLRFATIAHNSGDGIFLPALPPANWTFHQCHKHYHSSKEFAHYHLIDKHGNVVGEGHKASFCLQDSGCKNPCAKTYVCDPTTQGISPGCYDTYLASRDCQWVDVTDVGPGTYTLRVTVNPIVNGEREVQERSYLNNIVECVVVIYESSAKALRCYQK